jgi:hypothetical protein
LWIIGGKRTEWSKQHEGKHGEYETKSTADFDAGVADHADALV